jgi:hypothetical protein
VDPRAGLEVLGKRRSVAQKHSALLLGKRMHILTTIYVKDKAAQWRQFPVSEFEVTVSCNESQYLRKILQF